jgi:hypothetical protein
VPASGPFAFEENAVLVLEGGNLDVNVHSLEQPVQIFLRLA